MRFDEYQHHTKATAIYPEAGRGTQLSLAYVGLGLGEAGEIQNQLKKVIRDDNGQLTAERQSAIAAELGDLLWYVARMATEIGVTLDEVAQNNLDKLNSRSQRDVIHGSGDDR